MKITELLSEGPTRAISKQQAIDAKMFGPVYHGTTDENRKSIDQEGFKIFGIDDIGNRNGFGNGGVFSNGGPSPVHLLGYGVYFTPSATVAKQYNQDSRKGIVEYYLDVPRLCEIGFTSINTMRKWWYENGFDFDNTLYARRDETYNKYAIGHIIDQEQIRATHHMTEVLKSKYDGVYLKRNSFRRGVDDTQVVVFDPNRIYRIDKKMSAGWDTGSVVTHNQRIHYSEEHMKEYGITAVKQPDGWTHVGRYASPDRWVPLIKIPPPGMKGVVVEKREAPRNYTSSSINHRYLNQAQHWIAVKWQKGGVQHNYIEAELDPVVMKE
jgi:hypothetical protein